MFRNCKELVNSGSRRDHFEELNFLDNDVNCSLRQIQNFHFNIRHLKPFDEVPPISTKLSKLKLIRAVPKTMELNCKLTIVGSLLQIKG